MNKHYFYLLLLLFCGLCLVSCSSTLRKKTASITPSSTEYITSTEIITKTQSQTLPTAVATTIPVISTRTPTPSVTLTPRPSFTLTTEPTSTPTEAESCPRLLPTGSPALLHSGSVLFTYSGPNIKPGVWGVSKDSTDPRVVFQPALPPNTWVKLSPDGSKLAWYDFDNQPETLVVDDLASQKETRYPWLKSWVYIFGWTADNRVMIDLTRGYPSGFVENGIYRAYAYFDIQTRAVETATEKIDLPGFDYLPHLGGGASVDPTGELVLYTAFGKIEGNGFDIILKNIKTGQVLWTQTGVNDLSFPTPDWTKDGSRVLFELINRKDNSVKISTLSRDGQHLVELKDITSFGEILRTLNWLPDEHFIEFTLFDGPGYLLDTATSEMREICSPDRLFMSGLWSPDSRQFVYVMRILENGEGTGMQELRILDRDTWTTQILQTVNTDAETPVFDILGWTPLTFP